MDMETAKVVLEVSSDAPREPVSILLVDDDPRNLNALESILTSPEYHLVRAKDADEALRALVSENFAVLVLDVRMPDISGLELAHIIKRRKKTQHLPIIFLTAYYQEDEHALQGYDAGAVDYLNKPCNPTVLRSKVAVFVDLFRANRALKEEIAERRAAEMKLAERTDEVQKMVVQLRALTMELTQAEQRERKRLARVLHDHIQQLLVSAQMQLTSVRQDEVSVSAGEALQAVESILKEAISASRSVTVELSPPILQEAGLAAGLKWLARRMAEKNQFQVRIEIEAPAEPDTEEERVLLFECIRELLFNVVKHAGVSEAGVAVLRNEDNWICVTVEDKGCGFDLGELRQRGADQTTFGLFSIQQRLMHLGGHMDIETAPGKGMRVVLRSPSKTGAILEKEDAPALEAAAGARTARLGANKSGSIGVLIVDDHKILRQGLLGLLRSEPDMRVVGEAENGRQAVELAGQLHPDVILMDVNMGEMNGPEATRAILQHNSAIKIIGLSMHIDLDVSIAMRNAGAVAYLTKGIASAELIATIRSCVGGHADDAAWRRHFGMTSEPIPERSLSADE